MSERTAFGTKLLKLRRCRGLTQQQLAGRSGLSQSAIRSYELGNRNPKPNHLEAIANALGVRYEALSDYGVDTEMEVIHALFRLDESLCLEPRLIDGQPCLAPPSRNLPMEKFMKDWLEKETQFQNKEITAGEYEDWKDMYSPY